MWSSARRLGSRGRAAGSRDRGPRVLGPAARALASAVLAVFFLVPVPGVRPPVAFGAGADAWKDTARYTLVLEADLPTVVVGSGERVRVWMPLPVRTFDQEIISERIDAPWPVRILEDGHGNRIAYFEGRGPIPAPATLRVVVDRRPSTGLPRAQVQAGAPDHPDRYRAGARLIPLEGVIRSIAEREGAQAEGTPAKVRAYYDYVVENLSYDKSGTGWGQGNAVWACANKRGNCTDFHSLFIGMARSQDIPARFVIGYPVPEGAAGTIGGYHCWAEFWDPAVGWVPVDSSEAKKRDRADDYFGRLPNDRIEFTTGRDLVLEPPQEAEPLNYFIHPYVEVDGRAPDEKVPLSISFERGVPSPDAGKDGGA